MGQYFFGQIIIAYVDDGRGSTKDRPAVIISSDDDLDAGADLEVIAITKGIESPCPPYHVVVQDSDTPDPETGLWYPCVAKCNWYRVIERRRVRARIGHMPDELLDEDLSDFQRSLRRRRFSRLAVSGDGWREEFPIHFSFILSSADNPPPACGIPPPARSSHVLSRPSSAASSAATRGAASMLARASRKRARVRRASTSWTDRAAS